MSFREKLHAAIRHLANDNGWGTTPHVMPTYYPLPPLAVRFAIANATTDAKHQPNLVVSEYTALGQALVAQYQVLVANGLKVYPFLGKGEPYANSKVMCAAIEETNTFYFLKTENAFGSGSRFEKNHMLKVTSVTDSNGDYLLLNDVFRIVHDIVAHFIGGYSFSGRGEYNGWLAHVATLPISSLPAITAETIAQTAFFEWGSHLRRINGTLPKMDDPDYVPRSKRPFADQKNFYPHVALLWYRSTIVKN